MKMLAVIVSGDFVLFTYLVERMRNIKWGYPQPYPIEHALSNQNLFQSLIKQRCTFMFPYLNLWIATCNPLLPTHHKT